MSVKCYERVFKYEMGFRRPKCVLKQFKGLKTRSVSKKRHLKLIAVQSAVHWRERTHTALVARWMTSSTTRSASTLT